MYLFQNYFFVKTTFIYVMGLLFPNATFIYFLKLIHSPFISTYITPPHLLPLHIYYPSTLPLHITDPHLFPISHADLTCRRTKFGVPPPRGTIQTRIVPPVAQSRRAICTYLYPKLVLDSVLHAQYTIIGISGTLYGICGCPLLKCGRLPDLLGCLVFVCKTATVEIHHGAQHNLS